MTSIDCVGTFFSIFIDPQPGAKYVETSRSFKKPYIDYFRFTAKPGKIWYTRHLCLTNIMIKPAGWHEIKKHSKQSFAFRLLWCILDSVSSGVEFSGESDNNN